MERMKLLGLDPASKRNLGWSAVELSPQKQNPKLICFAIEASTITLPSTKDVWEVQWPLFLSTDALILDQQPDMVIIEKTSHFSGSFVTGQVANCMGTIFAVCGKHNVPVK